LLSTHRAQTENRAAGSALPIALIHPSAWKVNSASFAFTEF
jgi:hypothetical protein